MSAPAAAHTPPVDQPPPPAAGSPFGGFWIRFAAYFVDSFIVSFGAFVLWTAWLFTMVMLDAGDAAIPLGMLVILALMQLYHAWFVSSARMATPGKRLCGLYVTDLEGHRLSFGRALWRNVAALLSYLTLYVGFIMAGFTERKRALHDMIVGTVVHRQPGGSAGMAVGLVVAALIVVAVIGIMAAIAIPAYNDFTMRSKTAAIYGAMSGLKTPIAEYALEKGAWPATWEQAGAANPMSQLGSPTRELVQDIRLGKAGEVIAAVTIYGESGEIRLTPKRTGDSFQWTCSSSREIRKYIIATCRS